LASIERPIGARFVVVSRTVFRVPRFEQSNRLPCVKDGEPAIERSFAPGGTDAPEGERLAASQIVSIDDKRPHAPSPFVRQ